jgi:hypothetical protein
MSFYDARCGLTGLSTKGHRVRLILLTRDRDGGEHAPVALPITGIYNRLGGIDRVELDYNACFVHAELSAMLVRGELALHGVALWERQHRRALGVDDLIAVLERGTTPGAGTVMLDGRPLVYTFVIDRVYRAVVDGAGPPPAADARLDALVQTAFRGRGPAAAIYARLAIASDDVQRAARRDLLDFIRFRAWFEPRAAWRPPTVGVHDDDTEDRFFAGALHRFEHAPHVVAALEHLWIGVAAVRGSRDLTGPVLRRRDRGASFVDGLTPADAIRV